ncbi:MAG: AbrB/MazE/SpoVT family DNA-binding domain-containing protein [Oscillospiraceae bacterium]|nr:AbrB/MazE/SpoVT family DNA-binding domain-containing protein [Oscillospiraceae bacterium]
MEIQKQLGQRGRVTIPLPMREKLGWQAGDLLAFREKGGKVTVTREYARPPTAKAPAAKDLILQLVLLVTGGERDG